MKKKILVSIVAASTLSAGGYKIPENSLNAVALSGAYVANAHGADAAYYNPAAMVYNDDVNTMEWDATYIHLTPIHYDNATTHIQSKSEDFLVPSFHFASKKLGDSGVRAGLSIVSPAGLSKRWDSAPAVYTAQEFSLTTVEVNPSFALPISATTSIGAGFRIIYSEGIAKGNANNAIVQDMKGDGIDYGFNLALTSKPAKELTLAATYRSKVNLGLEGDADLYHVVLVPPRNYSGSVELPIPAALNLSAAYQCDDKTVIEFNYEKTFWSAYKTLDFEFSDPTAEAVFGIPKTKNYTNTNTYRLGLTHKYDQWTAMAAVAYDETPVPESTLGYDLPDSDSWVYSIGGRYQYDSHWNFGLAALVSDKDSREVHNGPINGTFSNAGAYLVTAGVEYRF